MNKIGTIAWLTWKSAFRYRVFWVLAALLAVAVVGLPLVLKTDGTAKGLVQILLTYTLSATAALLGFATLWLSCGALARDVEEGQMQMVAVKPIARWQIWLGKWLGLLSLDAVLLALAGAAIFVLLQWRADRLPPDQQKILREEIFVSRGSVREPRPDFSRMVDAQMKKAVKDPSAISGFDLAEIRRQLTARIETNYTAVLPYHSRLFGFNLSTLKDRLHDIPLQLRVKFHTSSGNPDVQYVTLWRVGPTNSNRRVDFPESMPADSFQEFPLPPNLLDDRGLLFVEIGNPNDVEMNFPLGEGMELLYPESSFGINFIRGLLVVFCWLALLASIGLSAASFLSFPVAAFMSLAVLLIGLSSTTVSTVVEQGTITGFNSATSSYGHSVVDYVVVPIFTVTLKIINLVQNFSPIDSLSSGRSITWSQLGLAGAQIVLLLGGFFCVVGIILFTRRELAAAQGNS
jgi:ABC-type transport system involved in multi-copper enzyme maturation permease subunit